MTFGANSGGKQTLTFSGVEFVGYGTAGGLPGPRRQGQARRVDAESRAAAGRRSGGGGGRGGRGGRGGDPSIAAVNTLRRARRSDSSRQRRRLAVAGRTGAGAGAGRAGSRRPRPCSRRSRRWAAAAARRGRRRRRAWRRTRGAAAGRHHDRAEGRQRRAAAVHRRRDVLRGALRRRPGEVRRHQGQGRKRASRSPPMSLLGARSPSTSTTRSRSSPSSSARNVVGMIEGSDPKLKDTYVMFGAHLDHIGYSQTGGGSAADAERAAGAQPKRCRPSRRRARRRRIRQPGGTRTRGRRGRASGRGGAARRGRRGAAVAAPAGRNPVPFDQRDFISNGADDDGSGSTAVLAIAKAFATGPKPKRSIVFVWHTGEEAGPATARATTPTSRSCRSTRCRRSSTWTWSAATTATTSKATTPTRVFIVGADRISTDLHNLIVETNNDDGEAADARLRAERPDRSGGRLHAQRPLQLRGQGHPDRVLHDRAAPGLPPGDATRWTRSRSRRWRGSRSWSTRPASRSRTRTRSLERDNKGPRTGFGTKAEVIKK